MNKLSFKDFLNLKTIAQEVDLSLDTCHKEEVEVNKERINKLFDIAMFYYYNSSSYIVFVDDYNFKVRFKIRYLKDKNYKPDVYKVVEKACIYTKAHPEVSDYKLY